MEYFIVYRTTNLITGQYYIGKHRCKALVFDGYYGSNKNLQNDVSIFGDEYFVRETISIYQNESDCYIAENFEIGDRWKNDNLCYNRQPGGKGFSSGENHYVKNFGVTDEHRKNLSISRNKRPPPSLITCLKISKGNAGKVVSVTTRNRMSIAQSGSNNPMYNKFHTTDAKIAIGLGLKGKYTGTKNAGFVGYYVTPFGKFSTLKEAKNQIQIIGSNSIFNWCKNPDNIITRKMIGKSKYLTYDLIGKTFRELGFCMELT